MTALAQTNTSARARLHAGVILASAPVLCTIYWYFGQARSIAAPRFTDDFHGAIYQFGAMFVLMGLIPAIYVRGIWRRPLADVGLHAGDAKFGLQSLAILLPVVAVSAFVGARFPEVRGEYPLSRTLFARHDLVPWYELAYVLLYYVAWEFYFRGALLFGACEVMGDWPAILVQTTSSCLVHLGKPQSETFGSILFGIVLGWLALRTRSVFYGLAIHVTLGVLTDVFVIFFH